MANALERQTRLQKRRADKLEYMKGAVMHPVKTLKEREASGLPTLGRRGLGEFFTHGKAGVLEVPAKIDEKNKKSLVTSLGSLLMISGVLKNDHDLVDRAYELVEADVVYTKKTPRAKSSDFGLMIPPPNRVSNMSGLSVEAVMAMRDIFDYENAEGFTTSLTGYNLLSIIINDVDALIDRGIVGQAQQRETFDVAFRRLATVTGVPSFVIAPFIIADLLNSKPSEAAEWVRNLPPNMLRPALDALVGAAIGYEVGSRKDRNEIDPTNRHKIVDGLVGMVVGAGVGTGVEFLGGENIKAVNDTVAALGIGAELVHKTAKKIYFEPKNRIKESFENGISWLKENEAAVIPFMSSIFHQQGRRRMELYNIQDEPNRVVANKRSTYVHTVNQLESMGLTRADVAKLTNAQIADDRDLSKPELDALPKVVSSSFADTLFRSSLIESLRMMDYNRRHPKDYELMPILSPRNLRDYIYTHGAATRDGIDLAKAKKPTLALSILYPSLWVYNLLDFVQPTANPQKNEKNLKDAVNFAGRYENSGGTGIRMMSAVSFWREIWPQMVSANQFNDFYQIIANNLNDTNADGMRSNFSLVVQPNPMQEMLNALSVFYIDFTLPEYHGSSQRGAVKHIDSMVTNLVGEIDRSPRALMDLLTFISYSKSIVLSKPYFQKLGYNIEIDQGKFFLDTAVKNIETVVNRTIKILFDKYLANPKGLLLGFRDELANKSMTPERADAVYREVTALIEWTLREVPEFYSTPEGREVFRKLDSDIYERAGVYTPGNIFSGAYVDIFYNVIKVMNEHKNKEGWKADDQRTVALAEFSRLADKSLFVMLRNTLNVNINPSHQSTVEAAKITDYLTQNYGFFEFALNFATDESVVNISEALKRILGIIEQQAVEFASSELDQTLQSPERKKVRLMLTSISPRVLAELGQRGLNEHIESLARAAHDASVRINEEEAKKARARARAF